MFTEIVLSKFHTTKSKWIGGTDPFCICFVYPKNGTPVVVKGMSEETIEFVQKNFPYALYRYTYWDHGKSRGSWRFTCRGKYVKREGKKYRFEIYCGERVVATFTRKRVPKRWMPEFDPSDTD